MSSTEDITQEVLDRVINVQKTQSDMLETIEKRLMLIHESHRGLQEKLTRLRLAVDNLRQDVKR